MLETQPVHVRAPEEESCDSLNREKNLSVFFFFCKGHVVPNSFHVASVSMDLWSEVATDNNAN